MALGVLNNLSAVYAENNLNKTNASLQTVLQQLSSGSRINSGADDAAGLSLINGLAANSTALSQSATNATEGVGLLQVADGALSQISTLLNRAITLATEASNGTLNSTQEAAANQEYQSLLAEITNIGSTTTYNQQQVFSGKTISIYTGDSSSTGASLDNLNLRSISSSSVGDSNGSMSYTTGQNNVFINLSSTTKNAQSSDALTGGGKVTVTYQVPGSTATNTATISSTDGTVQGLITAINNSNLGLTASLGTALQAGSAAVTAVGGTANEEETGLIISGTSVSTGTTPGQIATLSLGAETSTITPSLTIVGSDGTQHTFPTTSYTTAANLVSAINATNWGVTASDDGSGNLSFASSSSTAHVIGNVTVTTPHTPSGNTLAMGSETGTFSTAGLTFTDSLGATHTLATSNYTTATALAAAVTAAGWSGVSASDSSGTLTFTFTGLGAVSGSATSTITAAASATSNYYTSGITNAAVGGIEDSVTQIAIPTAVADSNGTGIATISYTDSAGVSLSGTSLSTQTAAQSALTLLNSAVSAVSSMDGYIGAQINTLNSINTVMTTQQQDVLSAQNAIQATDYASATSNMSKYEVLSQTGIAALAQANSVQQEVTKLLQ
ncbi:MAG: flagellin [Terracidiphilus sp.]|nr:flagellin [Terracidiphilus sp.]